MKVLLFIVIANSLDLPLLPLALIHLSVPLSLRGSELNVRVNTHWRNICERRDARSKLNHALSVSEYPRVLLIILQG